MSTVKDLDQPKTSNVRLQHIGAKPQMSRLVVTARVGGGTSEELVEATKRLKALAKRVKVGKRFGASEVIRAERE